MDNLKQVRTHEPEPGNDYRYLNFLALVTLISRSAQHYYGRMDIDFDFADELAWTIAATLPSDVKLDAVNRLSARNIQRLATMKEEAREQYLNGRYGKRPPHESGGGAVGLYLMGLFGLLAAVLLWIA